MKNKDQVKCLLIFEILMRSIFVITRSFSFYLYAQYLILCLILKEK
jgi:hypothetical protein